VDWQAYPEEVVDRTWRADAARLHRVLDALGVRPSLDPTAPHPGGATLARVLDHLAEPGAETAVPETAVQETVVPEVLRETRQAADGRAGAEPADETDDTDPATERSAALAAGLSAELAREEVSAPKGATAPGHDSALWDDGALPLFPLQPPRTGRDLLADHVTAMVCCSAVDTAGAVPGLDWLDGPSLLLGGERAADLAPKVLSLIEEGDPGPLRAWLAASGIRPEKPVRLV
jgi:hypothetical protein